ncbi:hypothetical protein AB751O23_BW_00040, partial [Chlamydiales bacterium SCGC AB-751-O23]
MSPFNSILKFLGEGNSNPCSVLSLGGHTLEGSSSWVGSLAAKVLFSRSIKFASEEAKFLEEKSKEKQRTFSLLESGVSLSPLNNPTLISYNLSPSPLFFNQDASSNLPLTYSSDDDIRFPNPSPFNSSPPPINKPQAILMDRSVPLSLNLSRITIPNLSLENAPSDLRPSTESNDAIFKDNSYSELVKGAAFFLKTAQGPLFSNSEKGINLKFENIFSEMPQVFETGYKGHYTNAITIKLMGKCFVLVNNRGYSGRYKRSGISILKADKNTFNLLAFREWIHDSSRKKVFFRDLIQIKESLNCELFYFHEMKTQTSGNCTVASNKAALYALMCILHLNKIHSIHNSFDDIAVKRELEEAFSCLEPLYKEFTLFLRTEEIEKLFSLWDPSAEKEIKSDGDLKKHIQSYTLLSKVLEKFNGKEKLAGILIRVLYLRSKISKSLSIFFNKMEFLKDLNDKEILDLVKMIPFLINNGFIDRDFLSLNVEKVQDLFYFRSLLLEKRPDLTNSNANKSVSFKLNQWVQLNAE